jgi:hypothetical protein
LARWFLTIYPVTSSKDDVSAQQLQRQLGFRSYGTAWTWLRLHKIRRAMVDADRRQLEGAVEADQTLVGGRQPGKRRRGAVAAKYLQRYLDEFVFRFNRRRANSPVHGFARVLQNAVRIPPATRRGVVAAAGT